jgi:hypothetical protein
MAARQLMSLWGNFWRKQFPDNKQNRDAMRNLIAAPVYYDYTHEAWVVGSTYTGCGRPGWSCPCYGCRNAGMPVDFGANDVRAVDWKDPATKQLMRPKSQPGR